MVILVWLAYIDLGWFSVFGKHIINAGIKIPNSVIISGRSLYCTLINGSLKGENIIQFINAPTVIAIDVIFSIGVVILVSSSLIERRGEDRGGAHTSINSIRVEYAAVMIVATINISMIMALVGLYRVISRIISLE